MLRDLAKTAAGVPPPLSIRNMTVAYDRRAAVDDVSLTIRNGRLVAVVGPNGAGKSSLIRGVLGLVSASGTAEAFGRPVDAVRDRIAYVPQRAAVDWDFPASALDVVTMGLYRRAGWFRPITRSHKDRARAALAEVGMADFAARPIGALSGGQQQRVFFARALVQDADLLFLDEPFAGVDAVTEQIVFSKLKALRDDGKTIIVVHHDLDTVTDHFDDAVLLNKRLVASGPVDDVLTPDNLAIAYGGRLAKALAAVR